MRIIQYFLIGLFLSLFTIPAFANDCPPPFVVDINGLTCSYLDYTGVIITALPWDGAIDGFINPDSDFGKYLISKTTVFKPEGTAFIEFFLSTKEGVQKKVDVNFVDINGDVLFDPVEGDNYGVLTTLASGWDLFVSGAYIKPIPAPVVQPPGGQPTALFNIDGIKENILVTVLTIVGFLLTIFSLKYAWRFVGKELLFGGSDGYVTSIEIGKDGLTRDTYYSPDGKVERISYSNENAGNEEEDSHKFATGYSKDWDNIQEPPIKGDSLSESEWEGRILAFKRTGTW